MHIEHHMHMANVALHMRGGWLSVGYASRAKIPPTSGELTPTSGKLTVPPTRPPRNSIFGMDALSLGVSSVLSPLLTPFAAPVASDSDLSNTQGETGDGRRRASPWVTCMRR